MSDEIPYYQINEPAKGARFYNGTTTIGTSATLSIESSLSASGGKIQQASSSMSGDGQLASSGVIVKHGSASMSGSAEINGDAIEILKLISYMASTANLSANLTATKMAATSTSSTLTTSFISKAIRKANSLVSSSASLLASAISIKKTGGILTSQTASITFLSSTLRDFPQTSLQGNSSLSANNIIRFTTGSRYPGTLINMIDLDGKPLTVQGRTFSSSFENKFIENKNWNNTKSRYYKGSGAGKQKFSIKWDWLPSEKEQTIDNRFARNFIKDKADDPDVHTLKIYSYGVDKDDVFIETLYYVFISSYSEDLIRRDLTSGSYFWSCNLELEEA